MREQRERAQADAEGEEARRTPTSPPTARSLDGGGATTFTGYDEVVSPSDRRRGARRRRRVSRRRARARTSRSCSTARRSTPRVAASSPTRAACCSTVAPIVEVRDVQTPIPGLIVHRGRVVSGEVVVGDTAVAEVDVERRRAISRAHTATHLVHKAFRTTLGETATQAGSENAPGRFRFDFSSPAAVPPSVLRDVEQEVNEVLSADLPVRAEIMTQEQARDAGAMALFGEKYGDEVRVVSVGDWARELCGGTHAQRSGPARPGQDPRRVLDRCRRAPRRGAGRRRRLPVPGPRARARRPAHRRAQGAPRGAARPRRRADRAGCARSRRTSRRSGRVRCWRPPPSSRRTRPTCSASAS